MKFKIEDIPLEQPKILYGKVINMTGMRFGRLICLNLSKTDKSGTYWMCLCDCGNTKEINRINLMNGNTVSCGCYQLEVFSQNGKNAVKHGHSVARNSTYRSWEALRQRCNNPNSDWYHRYGGRGIKVCERWNNFANFLEDMGERPEGLTIDRKNPNGDYEPDNCKWATRKEQGLNKDKTNSKITNEDAVKIRLDTRTLGQIAKDWGVGTSTIHRIKQNKTHIS